jgi:hypothetical protein
MSAGDIILSLLIFGVFLGLTLFNIINVELKKVHQNWPEYRCNPVVMPLAAQLGPEGTNVGANFEYCIQHMQSDVMAFFLQPIEIAISAIAQIVMSIVSSLAELSAFFSMFRGMLSMIFGSLYGIVYNTVLHIMKMALTVEDIIRRMSGMLTITFYSLKTMGLNVGAMVNASTQLLSKSSPNG